MGLVTNLPVGTLAFVEGEMRVISEDNYLDVSSSLWWDALTKRLSTENRKQTFVWLLSTAQVEDLGKGGNLPFEDLVARYAEYEIGEAGVGLRLRRQDFMDLDGLGAASAAEWQKQVTRSAAYYPQKMIASLLKAGESTLGYDGVNFFSATHPVHPQDTARGTYTNVFTGAASGSTPGALPIDDSVAVDVATVNLAKALAWIATIPGPSGTSDHPRGLRGAKILVPPRMEFRVRQLLGMQFVGQVVTGGVATGDVSPAVNAMFGGLSIVVAPELSTAQGGSDTTWYIGVDEIGGELASFVLIEREAFRTMYYTGRDGGVEQAALDRMDMLEWHHKGRLSVGLGHPYGIFKVKPT